jgi:hypothetical protein
MRSTSRYCTFIGGNLVSWSKKLYVVRQSSAEAGYRAIAHGLCEFLWLKNLKHELGITNDDPMSLFCDNKATINIAHKHIEIERHFIKEKLNNKTICIPFVNSKNQLNDMFTKGLSSKVFHYFTCKMGMRDIKLHLEWECCGEYLYYNVKGCCVISCSCVHDVLCELT